MGAALAISMWQRSLMGAKHRILVAELPSISNRLAKNPSGWHRPAQNPRIEMAFDSLLA
jgi:hypothetical protein